MPREVTDEVQSLQPFILDNMLQFASRCFWPYAYFGGLREVSPRAISEPDFILIRDGKAVSVVEVNGVRTLPALGAREYRDDKKTKLAVDQVRHAKAIPETNELTNALRLHRLHNFLGQYLIDHLVGALFDIEVFETIRRRLPAAT